MFDGANLPGQLGPMECLCGCEVDMSKLHQIKDERVLLSGMGVVHYYMHTRYRNWFSNTKDGVLPSGVGKLQSWYVIVDPEWLEWGVFILVLIYK